MEVCDIVDAGVFQVAAPLGGVPELVAVRLFAALRQQECDAVFCDAFGELRVSLELPCVALVTVQSYYQRQWSAFVVWR